MKKNNFIAALLAAFLFLCHSTSVVAQEELASTIPTNAVGSQNIAVAESQTATGSSSAFISGGAPGSGIPAITVTTNPDGTEDYSINLQVLGLNDIVGLLACNGDFDDVVYPNCRGDVDIASSYGFATNAV